MQRLAWPAEFSCGVSADREGIFLECGVVTDVVGVCGCVLAGWSVFPALLRAGCLCFPLVFEGLVIPSGAGFRVCLPAPAQGAGFFRVSRPAPSLCVHPLGGWTHGLTCHGRCPFPPARPTAHPTLTKGGIAVAKVPRLRIALRRKPCAIPHCFGEVTGPLRCRPGAISSCPVCTPQGVAADAASSAGGLAAP
jgi:hypothetical protein